MSREIILTTFLPGSGLTDSRSDKSNIYSEQRESVTCEAGSLSDLTDF